MPGSLMSSIYVPLPRMKRGSSRRLTLLPNACKSVAMLLYLHWLRRGCAHLLASILNRLDDIDVARAAAEIARDRVAHFRFSGIGVLLQQRLAHQHHSRRAEAALQAMLLVEALLNGVQLAILLQTLDGLNLGAIDLRGQQRAGLGRNAVDQDGAGAAACRVAANVRAGEVGNLADKMHQQQAIFDIGLKGLAVEGYLDMLCHCAHPFCARSAASRSARAVSVRTTPRLYSAGPRKSEVGSAASPARRAASRMVCSSNCLPTRNCSASVGRIALGPTLVSPSPTCVQVCPCSVTCAPTAAMA